MIWPLPRESVESEEQFCYSIVAVDLGKLIGCCVRDQHVLFESQAVPSGPAHLGLLVLGDLFTYPTDFKL